MSDFAELKRYRSMTICCPRCWIGLRDAPGGPQCWKCGGTVGVKEPPTKWSPYLVPCPACQEDLMVHAGQDLVCLKCFHVAFGEAEAALAVVEPRDLRCRDCGGRVVRLNGSFYCAVAAKME